MNYSNITAAANTAATNEMAGLIAVGAVIAVYAAIILFYAILMGVLCKKLAKKKGYRGYFWTGFFLGFIGLIYVVGLPVKKKTRAIEE